MKDWTFVVEMDATGFEGNTETERVHEKIYRYQKNDDKDLLADYYIYQDKFFDGTMSNPKFYNTEMDCAFYADNRECLERIVPDEREELELDVLTRFNKYYGYDLDIPEDEEELE